MQKCLMIEKHYKSDLVNQINDYLDKDMKIVHISHSSYSQGQMSYYTALIIYEIVEE